VIYNFYGWRKLKRPVEFSTQWIFYLVAGCFYGAVFLRALLFFQDSPDLGRILLLLGICIVLGATESAISRKWKYYFPVYLALEVILIIYLLSMPGSRDFFAILFVIPTMQIMLRFDSWVGWIWIISCGLLMLFLFLKFFGTQVIAVAIVNTAGNIFFGAYALFTRRAQVAHAQNQALAQELDGVNHQLKDTLSQFEQLAIARERNRLARELHDSVTQTVFSMNLTVQSALLLYERDPGQVAGQLDRLTQLAHSALYEMQILIAELRPEKDPQGGLLPALRKHIADRQLQGDLSVVLDVEGDGILNSSEEQGLFRIAQEALNNVVKHAQAKQAHLKLHLSEPFWMEIVDQGQGFDLEKAPDQGHVGLLSMRERAEEIGWEFNIFTSPASGTWIRVERLALEKRQVGWTDQKKSKS
jgi:signal transduction histidine kinase